MINHEVVKTIHEAAAPVDYKYHGQNCRGPIPSAGAWGTQSLGRTSNMAFFATR